MPHFFDFIDRAGLPFGHERHEVSIRRPHAAWIEENLPNGAAAVQLNRSHRFSDLVLSIDLEQRQWLDAIDGHRTIAGILDMGTARLGRSRRRTCPLLLREALVAQSDGFRRIQTRWRIG